MAEAKLEVPERYKPKKTSVREVFLDSGAYSLYTHNVSRKHGIKWSDPFFKSKEFRKYVKGYARFLVKHGHLFNYYASCDAIYDPETSWKVLKYLEGEYGLSPIPVVHCGTDIKWMHKYVDAGYGLIGIGGAGGATREFYKDWVDRIFNLVCDTPDRLPKVRTHGFAMTTYRFLIRYPWWSVDSTSWAKWAGFGIIYVPQWEKKKGFIFSRPPYPIFVSQESPRAVIEGRHVKTVSLGQRRMIRDWLRYIDVPYGTSQEWGVVSANAARVMANLKFFEEMLKWLPDYPWAFKKAIIQPRFVVEEMKWQR